MNGGGETSNCTFCIEGGGSETTTTILGAYIGVLSSGHTAFAFTGDQVTLVGSVNYSGSGGTLISGNADGSLVAADTFTGITSQIINSEATIGGAVIYGGPNLNLGGSLSFAASGTGNLAAGSGALGSVTSQYDNTAIGVNTLNDATGVENTALGYGAGSGKSGLLQSIYIGYNAIPQANNDVDEIAIGSGGGGSGTVVIGDGGINDNYFYGNIHTQTGAFFGGGSQSISGCSLSANQGHATAGKFTSGTSGTCTVAITLPTANHGWNCSAHDLTTPADTLGPVASGFSATSVTIVGTTVSGDVITYACTEF